MAHGGALERGTQVARRGIEDCALDDGDEEAAERGVGEEEFGQGPRVGGEDGGFFGGCQGGAGDAAEARKAAQRDTERTPDLGHFRADHGLFALAVRKGQAGEAARPLAGESGANLDGDLVEFARDG